MVAPYPKPQEYGGTSPYGRVWNRFYVEAPEFFTEVYQYADGNADHLLWADGKNLVFVLEYDGLTEAQAAVFDAHYESAKGDFLGFTFYDHRTGTTYADVHYLSYERPGTQQRWIQKRMVKLIKRGVPI